MILYSITTCQDDDEKVTGLQFSLSSASHRTPGAVRFPINPIGRISDLAWQCEEIVLSGPLDSIQASYDEKDGVDAIRYTRGTSELVYGDMGEDNRTWIFTKKDPLVGIFGNQGEEKI